jgi:pimeloyl-ACP methyl ester carboxylesterase
VGRSTLGFLAATGCAGETANDGPGTRRAKELRYGQPAAIGSNQVTALVYLNGWMCDEGESQEELAAAAFAGTPTGPLAWKTLPCWYLLGTEDKAIPPALQRFMAERADATIVEVPASHVSFVSQPDAATQLILQAVEATMPATSRT